MARQPRLLKAIKTELKKMIWPFRMATANQRALPSFIIIGAQKGGSSSLYNYIGQHPDVIRSVHKEVKYFCGGYRAHTDHFAFGENWYRAHFPLKRSLAGGKITGEATPLYISNPLVPQRMFDLLPEVKVLAVLRNPVDRAISHYFHMIRKGFETLPIEEALDLEESRLRQPIAEADYRSHAFLNWAYQRRGIYVDQLKPYFEIFPKQNIKIISSDALFKKSEETMKSVFEFLNLDAGVKVNTQLVVNEAPNRTTVPTSVYERLYAYFEEPNRRLFEFLGESYNWQPRA